VGQEATVVLEAACQADIRIVFPNGGAEERRELDLCTTPRLLLAPGWVLGAEPLVAATGVVERGATGVVERGATGVVERGATGVVEQGATGVMEQGATGVAEQGATDPDAAEAPVLKLRNAGTTPIIEIYAAPPGEPRGVDRLGADVLGVGEGLELEAPDGDGCIADLVALFRDGREVTRQGLDLCQGEEIEIR
jgi:hypothetical protein